jgi:hypothetical protein
MKRRVAAGQVMPEFLLVAIVVVAALFLPVRDGQSIVEQLVRAMWQWFQLHALVISIF